MGSIITALIAGIGLSNLAPFLSSFAAQAATNKANEQAARALRDIRVARGEVK